MELTHTPSGPVLLVPRARYHGVCAQLGAVIHTFCKAQRNLVGELNGHSVCLPLCLSVFIFVSSLYTLPTIFLSLQVR